MSGFSEFSTSECSPVRPGDFHVYPRNSASGCHQGRCETAAPWVESYPSSYLCWGHLLPQQAHLSAFCWAGTTHRRSGLCLMPAPWRAKCGSVNKWEIKELQPPTPSAKLHQRTEAILSTSLLHGDSPGHLLTQTLLPWPPRTWERPWPLP